MLKVLFILLIGIFGIGCGIGMGIFFNYLHGLISREIDPADAAALVKLLKKRGASSEYLKGIKGDIAAIEDEIRRVTGI